MPSSFALAGALPFEKYGNLLSALSGNSDYDVKTEIENNIIAFKADAQNLELFGAA